MCWNFPASHIDTSFPDFPRAFSRPLIILTRLAAQDRRRVVWLVAADCFQHKFWWSWFLHIESESGQIHWIWVRLDTESSREWSFPRELPDRSCVFLVRPSLFCWCQYLLVFAVTVVVRCIFSRLPWSWERMIGTGQVKMSQSSLFFTEIHFVLNRSFSNCCKLLGSFRVVKKLIF